MNKPSDSASISSLLRGLLPALALLALLLPGCGYFEKKPIAVPPPPPQPPIQHAQTGKPAIKPAPGGLLAQADQALQAGNLLKAEQLYGQAAKDMSLPLEQRRLAWRRLVETALRAKRATVATDALRAWKTADPAAANDVAWQDLVVQSWQAMPDSQAKMQSLQAIRQDPAQPARLRPLAAVALAAAHWRQNDLQAAVALLRDPTIPPVQADAEMVLFQELALMQAAQVESLALLLSPAEGGQFPGAVIQLDRARRLQAQNPAQALDLVRQVQGAVRNKDLLAQFAGMGTATQAGGQTGSMTGGVAIAVPLSGSFGNIGWKIVRGAGVARDQLSRQGVAMAVEAIDTEQPDWQDKLRALPETVTVVGGPLKADAIQALAASGLTQRFAFFAFANGLGSMREGQDAWRFFSSPQDQVRALLDFARDRFQIQNVAVLSPGDDFGQRMSDLFQQEARARGLHIAASETYGETNKNAWYDLVGRFSKGSEFQAVFLPAGFDHAEVMLPNFIYHQRRDLLFLGPSLWGQTLAKPRNLVERDFQRAAFPWAWRADVLNSQAQTMAAALQAEGAGAPDVWSAIGYDFVRFAHALGPQTLPIAPAAINSRLSSISIDWSMAPVRYDGSGRASQELFIFRPTSAGYALFEGDASTMPAEAPGGEPVQAGQGGPAGQAGAPLKPGEAHAAPLSDELRSPPQTNLPPGEQDSPPPPRRQ